MQTILIAICLLLAVIVALLTAIYVEQKASRRVRLGTIVPSSKPGEPAVERFVEYPVGSLKPIRKDEGEEARRKAEDGPLFLPGDPEGEVEAWEESRR